MTKTIDLRVDAEKGWVFHDGEPRWRSTQAALARLQGQQLRWLVSRHARVLHLLSGKPVATLRHIPAHRRWIGRVEGFSFWGHNRVMNQDMYMDPVGFDRVDQARRFVETIVRHAGATIAA